MSTPRSDLSQFVSGYCGEYYGIADQQPDEPDHAFQSRVAGALRAKRRLIEAHEVAAGSRHDGAGGANVMAGLMGAAAIALNNAPYGANRYPGGIPDARAAESVLDDERVCGLYLEEKAKHPDPPVEVLLMALALDDAKRR